MSWDVQFTDEFGLWWEALDEGVQNSIDVGVHLLESKGPHLEYPFSSAVISSRHSHMRELRVQHGGRPYRILYAFDPRRVAVLLIGGRKGSGRRWYQRHVRWADDLYDEHLEKLKKETPDDDT